MPNSVFSFYSAVSIVYYSTCHLSRTLYQTMQGGYTEYKGNPLERRRAVHFNSHGKIRHVLLQLDTKTLTWSISVAVLQNLQICDSVQDRPYDRISMTELESTDEAMNKCTPIGRYRRQGRGKKEGIIRKDPHTGPCSSCCSKRTSLRHMTDLKVKVRELGNEFLEIKQVVCRAMDAHLKPFQDKDEEPANGGIATSVLGKAAGTKTGGELRGWRSLEGEAEAGVAERISWNCIKRRWRMTENSHDICTSLLSSTHSWLIQIKTGHTVLSLPHSTAFWTDEKEFLPLAQEATVNWACY